MSKIQPWVLRVYGFTEGTKHARVENNHRTSKTGTTEDAESEFKFKGRRMCFRYPYSPVRCRQDSPRVHI